MDATKYIDRLSQLITEDIDAINELNLGFSPSKAHDSKAWNHSPVAGTVKGVLSKIHADSKVLAGIKTVAGPAYLAAPENFKSLDGQLNTMKTNTITVKDHTIVGKLAETGSEAAKKLGILIGQLHLADQKLQWGKAALVVGNSSKPFMQWIQHLAKIGAIVYGPSTIVNPKQTTGEWPGQEQIPEPEKQPQKYKDISKSLAGAQKEFNPKASAIFDEMKNRNVFTKNYITPARKILADVGRFLTTGKRYSSDADNDLKTLIANTHSAIKIIAKLQAAASIPVNEEDRRSAVGNLNDIFSKMGLSGKYLTTVDQLEQVANLFRKNEISRSDVASKIAIYSETILSQLNELFDSLKKLVRLGVDKLGPSKFTPIDGKGAKALVAGEQRLSFDKFKSWLRTGLSPAVIMKIFNIGNNLASQLSKKYATQLQA